MPPTPIESEGDLTIQPPIARQNALDTSTVVSAELQAEIAVPLIVTFQAHSCHFAGRGAAALLALFQAISETGGEVLLPTLVCPSVPLACMLGGLIPVFCDVRPSDYTLDPASVEAAITAKTVAIVAVHLFGHPCDMPALRAIADKHQLLLIEDCAQSLGQFDDDTWLGSTGDATLLSFHPSKILPAAGGGALLLREGGADLAERVDQAIAAFPEESPMTTDAATDLVRRGNAILNAARLDPTYAPRYRTLMGDLAGGIASQISIPQMQGIHREWETLDRVIPQRELRATRYEALLDDPLLIHPQLRSDARPLFRYTIRSSEVGEGAVYAAWHATASLRAAGIHASNLYFPAHLLFGETEPRPIAETVGRQLVNLWLDRSATAEAMLLTRRVLAGVLRRSSSYRTPALG